MYLLAKRGTVSGRLDEATSLLRPLPASRLQIVPMTGYDEEFKRLRSRDAHRPRRWRLMLAGLLSGFMFAVTLAALAGRPLPWWVRLW